MKNKISAHTVWRPFLDRMPQLFFRPKYVWFQVHLKDPVISDPCGQLAELIAYITSTRVDLYSHQIHLPDLCFDSPYRKALEAIRDEEYASVLDLASQELKNNNSPHRAEALLLRATFHLLWGDNISALKDFDEVLALPGVNKRVSV